MVASGITFEVPESLAKENHFGLRRRFPHLEVGSCRATLRTGDRRGAGSDNSFSACLSVDTDIGEDMHRL